MNLTKHKRAEPKKRFTVYEVPSDYMLPTMQPGDLIEIDTIVASVDADGIYLVDFPAGMPALRRVQVLLGSKRVRVSCDRSPAAADECESKDLRILGRATRSMNVRQL